MKPDDLAKLKDAFRKAIDNCETPDRPAFFVGPRCMSVRQFAEEVINETAFGREVIDEHDAAIRKDNQNIDEYCARIANSTRPAPQKP